MTCDTMKTVLHGYLDGELDAARAAEFEAHLEGCPQCLAELESQETLRTSIRNAGLFERAPSALRQRVLASTNVAARRDAKQAEWSWLAWAACFLVLLYAGWQVARDSFARRTDGALTTQVIDDHIRSLQPGHLSDVISTDQHTVKPWFDGKLDFAPPVTDFTEQGFPLQGGRLDVVDGRTVAALVYGRRKHFINVFVWPKTGAASAAESGSRNGYNWERWNDGRFEMWAVSDVSAGDLQQLQELLQRQNH